MSTNKTKTGKYLHQLTDKIKSICLIVVIYNLLFLKFVLVPKKKKNKISKNYFKVHNYSNVATINKNENLHAC